MDRYWENAGVQQPPTVPAETSGAYPTDGNLAAAVPPSTPGAWWYHQISEEIRNAIIALGGAPDFTQVDQLANVLLASLSSSINGLVEQLAKVAYSGSYTDLSNKPAIQAPLGFTPVQQGGGVGQGVNKIYIGWRSGGGLGVTVDVSDQGNVVFESELSADVTNLQNGINAVSAVANAAWNVNTLDPRTLGSIGNTIIVSNSVAVNSVIANPSVRPSGPSVPGTWRGCGEFSSGSDTFSLVVRVY